MTRLPLGPLIQPRYIHDDLPVGREFHVRAIHRTRRRPFEVHAFAVVAASVARTLEFVFAGFPIRRATQVRAPRVDHEHSVRRAIHPDPVFLLPFRVYAERVVRRISNFENGRRFKKSTRKKKSQKRDEPGSEKSRNTAPHQTPAPRAHLAVVRTNRRNSRCRRSLRRTYRRRTHIARRLRAACSRLGCIRLSVCPTWSPGPPCLPPGHGFSNLARGDGELRRQLPPLDLGLAASATSRRRKNLVSLLANYVSQQIRSKNEAFEALSDQIVVLPAQQSRTSCSVEFVTKTSEG